MYLRNRVIEYQSIIVDGDVDKVERHLLKKNQRRWKCSQVRDR